MQILSQNKEKVTIIDGNADILILKNNTLIKYNNAPVDSYLLLVRNFNGIRGVSVLGYFDTFEIAKFVLKKIEKKKKKLIEVPEHNFKVEEFIANVEEKRKNRKYNEGQNFSMFNYSSLKEEGKD